jgi:hypothetical protein
MNAEMSKSRFGRRFFTPIRLPEFQVLSPVGYENERLPSDSSSVQFGRSGNAGFRSPDQPFAKCDHMPKEHSISLSRRIFLREAIGATAAATLFSVRPYQALASASGPKQKVVIITFGGGARDDETFSLEGQQYIPHLLNTLAPQSSFFSQVVNRGILGHYVATASIATGAYETFDNFVAQGPAHPTIFEYFRKDLHRRREDAWVIAPSDLFAEMGASRDRRYGPDLGSELILPKQLLAAALGGGAGSQLNAYPDLLRDNYEIPSSGDRRMQIAGQTEMESLLARLKLDPAELRTRAATLVSPDELSVYMTRHVMREFAPSLLFLTLHDIDIAHSGAYSLYLEGIRCTDRLSAEIWEEIQSNPEYKDRTTLFILPDFGRDGDNDSGGNGFQHHRTGSALARTTWMMTLGPGIRQNTVVHRAIDSIDLVPSVAHLMGFDAPFAQGQRIAELA